MGVFFLFIYILIFLFVAQTSSPQSVLHHLLHSLCPFGACIVCVLLFKSDTTIWTSFFSFFFFFFFFCVTKAGLLLHLLHTFTPPQHFGVGGWGDVGGVGRGGGREIGRKEFGNLLSCGKKVTCFFQFQNGIFPSPLLKGVAVFPSDDGCMHIACNLSKSTSQVTVRARFRTKPRRPVAFLFWGRGGVGVGVVGLLLLLLFF